MNHDLQINQNAEQTYHSIRNSIVSAQHRLSAAVNSTMVITYWEIGEQIYKACGENDRAEYGKKLLDYLSEQLTVEFGKGFTVRNLRAMRQFYCLFPIRHTLCAELSWSHYRLLMRVQDEQARTFYAEECAKSAWSVRQLERQINTMYYQRILASQDKLIAVVAGSWLGREQRELADSVIRFHVIANSDSEADQALKLAVRDRVLARAEEMYPEGATLAQAQEALEGHLNLLAAAGREVVEEQGYDYPVAATLEDCWFPTKEYEGFALPAGNYTALRVTIGEGKGQNWWCVAFPPLCLGAASETVDQALEAGHFTPGQGALVTGDGEGYVLKFKAMELLGELQGFLEG